MMEQEKIEAIAEVLDCDAASLSPDTQLDEVGWDSMAMLGVIAMVKARFDKKLPGAEIRSFETIGDILAVMEK